MSTIIKDLGAVTAYAYAVEQGYEGTEEEFAELMASYAEVAIEAEASAQSAALSAETATAQAQAASDSADEASASATTAGTKADEASQSATLASGKASDASTYANTATTKAGEAASSAASASQSASSAASDAATITALISTAEGYANRAEAAVTAAEGFAEDASDSATSAESSATSASGSASTATQKAAAASGSASTAMDSALKSEGYAVGKQNGSDVGSDSPYYHNNAKYYAEEASGSATSASGSATTASTKASEASASATTASTKATEASASATAAETSATAASTSADEAEASAQTVAEAVERLEEIDHKAPVIISTASGSIASFADGADDMPCKSVVCQIDAVQSGSGDPSPTNVRPITGWDGVTVVRNGKNLFDPNSADKEWVRTSDWAIIQQNSAKSVRVKAAEGETFTLSNDNTASATNVLMLAFISADGTVISRNFVASGTTYITRTAPANTASLLASFFTWSDVSNAQLELGSSASAYEPYAGDSHSLSFPQTVYGGWVDAVKGELHVTHKRITIDGSTYKFSGGYGAAGPQRIPCVMLASSEKAINEPTSIITSYLVTVSSHYYLSNKKNSVMLAYSASNSMIACRINDILGTDNSHGYSSDSELFAAANAYVSENPLTAVYKLATEQVYDLDPITISTLLGNNNIYCNTGDTTAEYPADTKLYIEHLTAPDHDMIADSNIASGKFFMVGNNLYISTSAIASGETIVPGTNCTQVSLASALNSLAEG